MDVIINLQQPLPKRSTCVQQAANRLKPWNGDLSESGAKKMTLIYRGQKYVQNKEAAKKQHNELIYRGKAYTSQFIYPKNKKATFSGFFCQNLI